MSSEGRFGPAIKTTNRRVRDIAKEALDALEARNDPPTIFVRGGRLVRVWKDETNHPVLELLSEPTLRHELERAADFTKTRQSFEVPTYPPAEVVHDILASTDWPFPRLDAIVESPVLRPDGSILLTPGYDEETHLYFWWTEPIR